MDYATYKKVEKLITDTEKQIRSVEMELERLPDIKLINQIVTIYHLSTNGSSYELVTVRDSRYSEHSRSPLNNLIMESVRKSVLKTVASERDRLNTKASDLQSLLRNIRLQHSIPLATEVK